MLIAAAAAMVDDQINVEIKGRIENWVGSMLVLRSVQLWIGLYGQINVGVVRR